MWPCSTKLVVKCVMGSFVKRKYEILRKETEGEETLIAYYPNRGAKCETELLPPLSLILAAIYGAVTQLIHNMASEPFPMMLRCSYTHTHLVPSFTQRLCSGGGSVCFGLSFHLFNCWSSYVVSEGHVHFSILIISASGCPGLRV